MSAATRLPRGRHSLSREQVARSQRERLVGAMAEVMAGKGYARTSVADILRVAGVSRETFYEQFSSKEDCFMSAFEEAYGLILTATAAGTGADSGEPHAVLEQILAGYLDALAGSPALARVFLVEVYAAGPEALARRAELQRGLVTALAAVLETEDRFAVEALVAAITALVTARLVAGDIEGLRALREPLTELTRKVVAA